MRPGSESDRLPAQIGPYQVLERLGKGGMGQVYLAQRPGDPRQVAVKVLLDVTGSDALLRFQREARLAAQLEHPQIVRCLEIGQDPRYQRPYIVMEFAPGESLRQRLDREGRLSPAEAARVVAALADVVAAAHEAGAVHRDLKPENVVMDAQSGLPRLLDFGVARDQLAHTTTQTGEILGSPPYLPPEVLKGARATTTADIYALGVILYELLSGKRPYRGSNLVELSQKILAGDVEDLSTWARGVPPALDAVCRKAMATEPRDRFGSARELAMALRESMTPGRDPRRTSARGAPARGPSGGEGRRRGGPPAAVGVAAAIVVVGAGLALGLALAGGGGSGESARASPPPSSPAAASPSPAAPSPSVSPSPVASPAAPSPPAAPDPLLELERLLAAGEFDRCTQMLMTRQRELEQTPGWREMVKSYNQAKEMQERELAESTRLLETLRLEEAYARLEALLARWSGSAEVLARSVNLELSRGHRREALANAQRALELAGPRGQDELGRLVEQVQQLCKGYRRPSMKGDPFFQQFELVGGADWRLGEDGVLTVSGKGIGPGDSAVAYLRAPDAKGRFSWSVELQADWPARGRGGLGLLLGGRRLFESLFVSFSLLGPPDPEFLLIGGEEGRERIRREEGVLPKRITLIGVKDGGINFRGRYAPKVPDSGWIRLAVEAEGSTIQVFVNDQAVGDPVEMGQTTAGRVGLSTTDGLEVRFRNWRFEQR